MKLFIQSMLLVCVVEQALCQAPDVSEKEVIEFLLKHADELLVSTEAFLHEQRRLGNERLLQGLEQKLIDLELVMIDIRNRRNRHEDAITVELIHEIHQIEQKIFLLEEQITEDILRIQHGQLTGNFTTQSPTIALGSTTKQATAENSIIAEARELVTKANELLKTYTGQFAAAITTDRNNLQTIIIYYDQSHSDVTRQSYLQRMTPINIRLKSYLQTIH